jgi:hypothetical protein
MSSASGIGARDGERRGHARIPVTVDQLAPDEVLSPELVLVLSPALRAQAVGRLGAPVWPTPRRRVTAVDLTAIDPSERSLGQILLARVVQLGVTFVALTVLTLAMSLAAHALR